MIDERQRQAIELLVSGEHTKVEIAKSVGISRGTLYNYLDNEEFMGELNKRLQDVKTLAEKEFDAKLDTAIDLYWKLATSPDTDNRTKQIALSYIIDRSLGRTTSKTEISNSTIDTKVTEDDILSAIDVARATEDDEKDNITYMN